MFACYTISQYGDAAVSWISYFVYFIVNDICNAITIGHNAVSMFTGIEFTDIKHVIFIMKTTLNIPMKNIQIMIIHQK